MWSTARCRLALPGWEGAASERDTGLSTRPGMPAANDGMALTADAGIAAAGIADAGTAASTFSGCHVRGAICTEAALILDGVCWRASQNRTDTHPGKPGHARDRLNVGLHDALHVETRTTLKMDSPFSGLSGQKVQRVRCGSMRTCSIACTLRDRESPPDTHISSSPPPPTLTSASL
jgi:hypothetical protein